MRVTLEKGTEASQKLRSVLLRRAADKAAPSTTPLPKSDAARRFWSERAWSELTAVPAMSQTLLSAMRAGTTLSELGALAIIGADEVRHTELSQTLADDLGGYVADLPEWNQFNPSALAEASSAPVAFWIVGNACISETISLELMRARMHYTTHPAVKSVLADVLRDEATHSRLGWLMAERVLPTLKRPQKRELARFAAEYFEVLNRSFVTRGLPPSQRRAARRIREKSVGLGAAPPEVAESVFDETIRKTIIPRLQTLGVRVG